MNREIVEGPAVVEFNSFLYYSEGNIVITQNFAPRRMRSSRFGPAGRRVTDKLFTVQFTPIGMMDNNRASYFPFTAADLGKRLAPAVEQNLIIWDANGLKHSYPGACISQCPQLMLGVDKGPMGQMSISAMGSKTLADAAADAHYKIETASLAAHTLDWDKAPTPAYKVVFTLAGEPDVETELDGINGFTFDWKPTLNPSKVNRYGTINFKLSDFDPVITFSPAYQTEQAMLDFRRIQGALGVALGGGLSVGQSLSLLPAEDGAKGIQIDFPDFCIEDGSMIFGEDDPRHGDYAFVPSPVSGEDICTVTFPTWA